MTALLSAFIKLQTAKRASFFSEQMLEIEMNRSHLGRNAPFSATDFHPLPTTKLRGVDLKKAR